MKKVFGKMEKVFGGKRIMLWLGEDKIPFSEKLRIRNKGERGVEKSALILLWNLSYGENKMVFALRVGDR